MTPMQQILLGVGASKKTYMDDVFNTQLYTGNNSTSRAFNTGVNMTKGGMLWVKNRNNVYEHIVLDTERQVNQYLRTSSNIAQSTEGTVGQANNDLVQSWNNNGFTVSNNTRLNATNENPDQTYAAWSFRKAKGFFDVVKYTGNGSNRTISHSLGSVPGMILVKSLDETEHWNVYHRGITAEKYIQLSADGASVDVNTLWNDTEPTASVFSVGTDAGVNKNSINYIAYVFAGGESTAATARSVDMDGSNDYLTLADSADWDLGQTFTIEAWVKLDAINDYNVIIAQAVGSGNNWYMSVNINGSCQFYDFDGAEVINSAAGAVSIGQWTHVAIVNNSGTAQWYINGIPSGTAASLNVAGGTLGVSIGSQGGSYKVNGKISNLRLVKGTAVYTSAFRPPTEPLTNITNTKLLCCNNSSTTGSTVTPGTITASGSPTASIDSPFDDPAGFVFGENQDQNLIKCGSYTGNGNADGPEINLGWEPQWILLKNASNTAHWLLLDSMIGIVNGTGDRALYPNLTNAEGTGFTRIDLMSNGFKITENDTKLNTNGETYFYVAIRRPDGYVGKPAELGTSVFAMDTGAGSSTIPNFDSGFPVDFQFALNPAGTDPRYVGTRLTQGKLMYLNTNGAESGASDHVYDSNVGWNKYNGWGSNHQSWMWKRHAGFDVVTYKGNEVSGRQLPHNLSKIPEMMWVKSRSNAEDWAVYHKGLNGGTNPEQYYILLNTTAAEVGVNTNRWKQTAPTATHFTLGDAGIVNAAQDYIAMLFASVDGISKVGYYTGDGSTSHTITTGFQPRFLIIKITNGANSWFVYDSVRGLGSGNDPYLQLENTNAQGGTSDDVFSVSSTGFTILKSWDSVNGTSNKYIYYAHA